MKIWIKKYIEENLHADDKGKFIDLSHEKLLIEDFRWLAEVIKKSSFVETIVLPNVSPYDASIILPILDHATINNSTLLKMDIHFSDQQHTIPEHVARIKQDIQDRLQRNQRKIMGIHGGGNIGLGLMADIVAKSQRGYHMLATSNNQFTSKLVNSVNKLWLQHGPSEHDDVTCVNDVTMISRERQDIIRLYTEACIVAVCVTPSVIPTIAKDIAQGLIQRYKRDGSGLKILVLMNIPNCAELVREKITNELLLLTTDKAYADKILSGIQFVSTVIDRIVTAIAEDKIKHQLKRQLSKVDPNALAFHLNENNIDTILSTPEKLIKAVSIFNLQFNLFNAEKKFTMHVSNHFLEAYRFPSIKMTKDLTMIEAVKNKYINGPHAILAWAGALLGYKTIAEAIQHPTLFAFIKDMMENEIGPILCAEYPELSKEDLDKLEANFLERCKASVDDPVTRVGRDPKRKDGRIRGTIELAQKHNLNITTTRLEQGLVAGKLYVKFNPGNPGAGLNHYKAERLMNRILSPAASEKQSAPIRLSIWRHKS